MHLYICVKFKIIVCQKCFSFCLLSFLFLWRPNYAPHREMRKLTLSISHVTRKIIKITILIIQIKWMQVQFRISKPCKSSTLRYHSQKKLVRSVRILLWLNKFTSNELHQPSQFFKNVECLYYNLLLLSILHFLN